MVATHQICSRQNASGRASCSDSISSNNGRCSSNTKMLACRNKNAMASSQRRKNGELHAKFCVRPRWKSVPCLSLGMCFDRPYISSAGALILHLAYGAQLCLLCAWRSQELLHHRPHRPRQVHLGRQANADDRSGAGRVKATVPGQTAGGAGQGRAGALLLSAADTQPNVGVAVSDSSSNATVLWRACFAGARGHNSKQAHTCRGRCTYALAASASVVQVFPAPHWTAALLLVPIWYDCGDAAPGWQLPCAFHLSMYPVSVLLPPFPPLSAFWPPCSLLGSLPGPTEPLPCYAHLCCDSVTCWIRLSVSVASPSRRRPPAWCTGTVTGTTTCSTSSTHPAMWTSATRSVQWPGGCIAPCSAVWWAVLLSSAVFVTQC